MLVHWRQRTSHDSQQRSIQLQPEMRSYMVIYILPGISGLVSLSSTLLDSSHDCLCQICLGANWKANYSEEGSKQASECIKRSKVVLMNLWFADCLHVDWDLIDRNYCYGAIWVQRRITGSYIIKLNITKIKYMCVDLRRKSYTLIHSLGFRPLNTFSITDMRVL